LGANHTPTPPPTYLQHHPASQRTVFRTQISADLKDKIIDPENL
jgi:hypothetical protein